ncbi:magnesium-translocating P-type ATPase [bacterium]|nr:magnesium-translocating P-type ATPase [bacterium]
MTEPFWLQPLTGLLASLDAGPDGLTEQEARSRLSRVGPNLPARAERAGVLRQFFDRFANPLVWILLAAAIISGAFGEALDAAIIVTIVLASVLVDFFQSYRSQRAAEALRHQVGIRVEVLRDGRCRTIPATEVVPGDVFLLSAGNMLVADARLIEAKDLFVDQAALTGESLPAEKRAVDLSGEAVGLDEAVNAVFAGTSVVSGTARAIAVKTGTATAFGDIAAHLAAQPPQTEFERGLAGFSAMILRVVIALVLFVFFVLALLKREPAEAFMFSLALAVGLTPEFLPMIIAVTLSRGAMRMAQKHVIVKQLQAIENFGSIDVLCSDKTGTLTQGVLALTASVDPLGREAPEVLAAAVLNSTYETGIRSPLDEAILRAPHPEPAACQKRDEIPFDFHRRRVSVVLDRAGETVLITKGAPEAVLAVSASYREEGRERALDESAREAALATFKRLSEQGLRLLAIAERSIEAKPVYGVEDERDLCLLGFVAFHDPPRADAQAALKALAADGIRVVILTGDNEWVTRHVCEAVGLDARRLMLGRDLERVRESALPWVVERVGVFARVTPEQKIRVLRALKVRGHVVGYLGDGINDAPCLRDADVGISVDSAVDVARAAASIILLERSLAVLHQGVLEGRRSFANVIKYILMAISSNFGNMFSMAGAALLLPFLPMLPMQILLNNLLYALSQLAIPGDRVEPEALLKPRRWDVRFIQRFMVVLGPISSIFDFLTFWLLLWAFRATAPLFHTAWFVESLLTQTLVVFVIRTSRSPFRHPAGRGLRLSVFGICAIAVLLPYSPLARALGFTPLPLSLLLSILGITAAYLLLAELAKRQFYRSAGGRGNSGGV